MTPSPNGAYLSVAPTDWQILQQDAEGAATMPLAGTWFGEAGGRVEVAVLYEDTSAPVCRATDWQPATTNADGTWSHTLRVPAGGLYRLQTRYRPASQTQGEWSLRGDERHFFGVGDLWVIAGQSNSAGYGRGPITDPPELGLHLYRNNMTWSLAMHPMNESTDTKHAVNRENANSGHSPYLNFARILKQHLGYPIGLVQTSLGGSPLTRWNPRQERDSGLYESMVTCIKACGGKVRGVLWYQGESDCGPQQRDTYRERFADAVASWREATGQPELPVLTVQLNRVFSPPTVESNEGWSTVREQQRQAALTIPGVFVTPAIDLPLSDVIHISPTGNMLLGDRMARLALGGVHGLDLPYLAPDLLRAEREGATIRLTFANVESRLDSFDAPSNPFVVWRGETALTIASVAYDSPSSVTLTLAEDPGAEALTVTSGYGIAPTTMPCDRERLLPMLCFHRIPVAATTTA